MGFGNAIAKGNVLITTDLDQLNSGLSKAGSKVQKWSKDTGQKAAGGFAFGGKAMAGALAVSTAFHGVEALANQFGTLTEKIDATSKLSATLDMPTESLVGWQHAAELSNVSSDELSSALLRFRKNSTGPMDQALGGLIGKLEGTKDAGERARILVDAFGKSGARLAPMFKDGAAGIEAMKQEAKDLGITFDKATGLQVEAANDAITKSKAAIKGVFQSTLVSFAPAIETVANFATKLIKGVRPFFDWAGRALDTYYTLWTSVLGAVAEFVSEAYTEIASMGEGLFGWTGELPTIQEVIVGVFRAVGTSAALAWDTIKLGAGIISIVAGNTVTAFGAVVNIFKRIASLAKELPEELRPAGVDRFIEGVEKFETGVFGAGEKLTTWGMDAITNWGAGATKFNVWLDKALVKKEKLADGKDILGGDDGFPKSDKLQLTGALLADSKEAYSLVLKNQFAELMGEGDTNKKILKAGEKGNRLKEKGNKRLDDIAEALEEVGSV